MGLDDIFTKISINSSNRPYMKFVLHKFWNLMNKELNDKLINSCDQSSLPHKVKNCFLIYQINYLAT